MKHRRAARIDSNQNQIVDALRDIPGVTVQPGHDDILVGYRGNTYWFEIKISPEAVIKPSQIKLTREWAGHYDIVHSIEQILETICPLPGKT